MRILVAEDECDLNDILVKQLTKSGFSVDTCYDGATALLYAEMTEYDALILDIMMPNESGISVLQKLRSQGKKVPVILLTAKSHVTDRVNGLNLGADDYITKPFSFDELLARLRVILRRTSGNATNIYTLENLTVDSEKCLAYRDGVPIKLTSREFALLEYLVRNKNIVLSREKIERHLWNYDYEGASNMVDVYIRYVRKKVDDNYEPKLIHTVRGLGYVARKE